MPSKNELNQEARRLFVSILRERGCRVYDSGQGDLEVRDTDRHWRITIRSVRNHNYAFVRKSQWRQIDGQLMGFAVFNSQGQSPQLFIIPAAAWTDPGPNLSRVLKERNYDKPGQKSEPEWGIDSRHDLLKPYLLDQVLPPGYGAFRFPQSADI
ncbi:MAG: hypothetical protein OWQ57_04375 [Sulfobacillus sp.]|nr:hypothetical protein [Sulfobacillus sp.]